jgi:DNA-binding response OmpR family regulator
VPVLLLGLLAGRDVVERIQGFGTVDYVAKPFGPVVLAQKTRRVIEDWEREQAIQPWRPQMNNDLLSDSLRGNV